MAWGARNLISTQVGENARRKEESEVPNKVFFANIRYDATEDDLRPFFSALALQVALYRVRCPPCANVREARCYLF